MDKNTKTDWQQHAKPRKINENPAFKEQDDKALEEAREASDVGKSNTGPHCSHVQGGCGRRLRGQMVPQSHLSLGGNHSHVPLLQHHVP